MARTALLIGSSTGAGRTPLQAPVHDLGTYLWLCLRLGYEPANIRILAPSGTTSADLAAQVPEPMRAAAATVEVRAANSSNAKACGEWLAEQLHRDDGILAFAGHGGLDADGELVLCLEDTEPDLSNAWRLGDLRDVLDATSPQRSLLVYLDTCFTGAESPTPDLMGPRDLVLCAARPGQASQERTFGNRVEGAMSFALRAVLEQRAETVRGPGGNCLDITHGDLEDNVRKLLEALGVPQQPVLNGPRSVLASAVGEPFESDGLGYTTQKHSFGTSVSFREIFVGDQGLGVFTIESLPDEAGKVHALGNLVIWLADGTQDPTTMEALGYKADREHWMWSQTPWPLQGYRLRAQSTQATLPDYSAWSTNLKARFRHREFADTQGQQLSVQQAWASAPNAKWFLVETKGLSIACTHRPTVIDDDGPGWWCRSVLPYRTIESDTDGLITFQPATGPILHNAFPGDVWPLED